MSTVHCCFVLTGMGSVGGKVGELVRDREKEREGGIIKALVRFTVGLY